MMCLQRIEPEEHGRVWDKMAIFRGSNAYGNNAGRNQDRAKVAGGRITEVKYAAGKTGSSKAQVKSAVKSVGNSRKKGRGQAGQEVRLRGKDAATVPPPRRR